MANANPAPGWYQDPRDSGKVRWWDGGQWTQNTQAMPSVAPEPTTDPWAAASEPPAAQQQPWSAQPAAEQPQWGQQPTAQPQPQWQQPASEQPQPQWGATSPQAAGWAQPQQGEGAWQQPGAEQQWGQQQPQPPAGGGWQQPAPGGWGSNVPPAPVPQGLAPGSPMGQTNVFPTAESVDPITGMPMSSGAGSGSPRDSKRLAALVVGALLVGLLIIGLLWFFLFRGSGDTTSGTSSGPVDVTASYMGTVDPACSDLGAALTADGLSETVVQRLNDVAIAKDLEENQAYFKQLNKDVKPIMDQYQSACIAAVSAGNAPEFYRTFVETFQTAVTDGATVATSALADGGQVPVGDADRLRAEASTLQASSEAVMAISGTSSPQPSTPTTSGSPSAAPTRSPTPTSTATQ